MTRSRTLHVAEIFGKVEGEERYIPIIVDVDGKLVLAADISIGDVTIPGSVKIEDKDNSAQKLAVAADGSIIVVNEPITRKYDLATSFTAKVSASGSNSIIVVGGAQILTVVKLFIQASPLITGNVEFVVKVGATEHFGGWLEASQPYLHTHPIVGAVGEDLTIELDAAKEVRINATYRIV